MTTMNAEVMNQHLGRAHTRWPFQRRSAAWLPESRNKPARCDKKQLSTINKT
jgi:hypothetical protein